MTGPSYRAVPRITNPVPTPIERSAAHPVGLWLGNSCRERQNRPRRRQVLPLARLVVLFALAAPLAPGGAASALELALPLACSPGVDCWVARHVDHAAGPGLRDHACGTLTDEGHDGVDLAIADLAAMARGIDVRAAAAGTVRAVRDGEPDLRVEERGRAAVDGRECGNGVLLEHPEGWQTQYCHLRRGSVAVRPGEEVAAGTRLGLVGLSGLTSFPHLHLTVRRAGRPVDPFTGTPPGAVACGAAGPGLWSAEAAAALAYTPVPLTGLGVAAREPVRAELDRGEHLEVTLPADAPALVVWARGFGLRRGDRWHLLLLDPAGRPVVDRRLEQDRDQAFAIRWAGRRRPAEGWPPGTWRARVEVERGGTRLALERTVTLGPG